MCFLAALFLPDSKDSKLGSSDQEVSPSTGKNTGVVLVLCHTWKCVTTAISGGVNISVFQGVICYNRGVLSQGHRAYCSSLLCAIIACNHQAFSNIFKFDIFLP